MTTELLNADDFTSFLVKGRTIEINNPSAIAVDDSKISCKVFVYIKEGDTDVLSVNHHVEATLGADDTVEVQGVKVIDARIPNNQDDCDYINDFAWGDLAEIKKQIGLYLADELLPY